MATNFYAYDGSNNLVSVTDPLGHVSRLTNYNGSGLPLNAIDGNGVVTRFSYDARDRLLTRVVQAASGNATNNFSYDAAGNVTKITLPDGSFLAYQYDAAHRLQSVTDGLLESISYSLDAAGNITNHTVENPNGYIVYLQRRVFDQLGRMIQQIAVNSHTNNFGYDPNGNRVSIRDGLNNVTSQSFDELKPFDKND